MRPFVRLNIFVLLFFLLSKIKKSYEFLPTEDEYVSFIIDICKFYETKSTIFLYANSTKEMEMTTMIFKWTRAFSRLGFTTSNLYFFELHESSYYMKRIVRPHYIAVISDDAAINEFSLATSTFDMSFAAWSVVFIYDGVNSNYCHSPPGNIFHLRYDSEILVRCNMENILREWYSIDENQTEISDLAIWSLDKGVTKIVPGSIYDRRYNLHGLVMKAVIVKEELLTNTNKDGELISLFGKVLKELCTILNFSIEVVSKVDEYGIWNPKENTWTGAVGEMYNGRADISIAEFAMTSARMNVVDFTLPLLLSESYIYIQEPQIFTVKWSSYFLIFTYSIWISIFGVLIVALFLLIFIKIKNKTNRNIGLLISDNFIEICGIFCQQGIADFPYRSSLRITYFSICLMALVLSAAYSATLISFLTSVIHVIPFRSLEDLVEDGTYKLSATRGTSDYDNLANSRGLLAKKLTDIMLEEEKLPLNKLEGFKNICKDKKLGIYTSNVNKDAVNDKIPCKVSSIKAGYINNLAVILSKHNPFIEVINFYLHKLINNGMIHRLKDMIFKKQSIGNIEYKPVHISSVLSVIFFILFGIILSTCILFIEKYIFSRKIKNELTMDRVQPIKSSKFYKKKKKNIKNIFNNTRIPNKKSFSIRNH